MVLKKVRHIHRKLALVTAAIILSFSLALGPVTPSVSADCVPSNSTTCT